MKRIILIAVVLLGFAGCQAHQTEIAALKDNADMVVLQQNPQNWQVAIFVKELPRKSESPVEKALISRDTSLIGKVVVEGKDFNFTKYYLWDTLRESWQSPQEKLILKYTENALKDTKPALTYAEKEKSH